MTNEQLFKLIPPTLTPIPLSAMARRLRVPVRWLRDEARAGRVPHLDAGGKLLFDPPTVQRILAERAAQTPMLEDHATREPVKKVTA